MTDEQMTIERYQVYTRDEAAALLRMTAMELDDVLQAAGLAGIETGRCKVYLGEVLLRAMGAEFSERADTPPAPHDISPHTAYSTDQAAQLLHISVRTLRRLSRDGQIKPARLGGRIVYQGQELLRFLKEERA